MGDDIKRLNKMSAREAIQECVRLGAKYEQRGGDVILTVPGRIPVRCAHWTRRKDASRALLLLLRDLYQAKHTGGSGEAHRDSLY